MLVTWAEIVASSLRSDKSLREELHDAVYNVAPSETPILSSLGDAAVKSRFPQWQTDTYRAAAGNAVVEGFSYTAYALTVPSRADNVVQTFYASGQVSDTQRNVDHAGMDDPLGYYEAKSVVEIKKDIELALIKGSAATGTTNTATRMNGLMNVISTNKTSLSGITFTENIFNNLLQLAWTNTAVMPTDVYVGPRLKRTITGYSTKVTPFISAQDKKQILTITQYESDFGAYRLHLHRELTSAASSVNELVAINPAWFATGWLQPLRREVLSRDGLSYRYQMSCETTLLHRNQRTAIAADLVQDYIPV